MFQCMLTTVCLQWKCHRITLNQKGRCWIRQTHHIDLSFGNTQNVSSMTDMYGTFFDRPDIKSHNRKTLWINGVYCETNPTVTHHRASCLCGWAVPLLSGVLYCYFGYCAWVCSCWYRHHGGTAAGIVGVADGDDTHSHFIGDPRGRCRCIAVLMLSWSLETSSLRGHSVCRRGSRTLGGKSNSGGESRVGEQLLSKHRHSVAQPQRSIG